MFLIDNNKWKDYISYFNRIAVPAKTILLKEGEIPKKMYLIEKGCMRVWFNNEGNDITVQFFFENSTVASIESFKKGLPSPLNIETIEPCVLWCINKKDFERIITKITEVPDLRIKYIDAIFERTFDYMKYFFSFLKDSPMQRYQNLINDNPKIVQRVPQHYIASYLGISAVHLSRIKKQIEKNQ